MSSLTCTKRNNLNAQQIGQLLPNVLSDSLCFFGPRWTSPSSSKRPHPETLNLYTCRRCRLHSFVLYITGSPDIGQVPARKAWLHNIFIRFNLPILFQSYLVFILLFHSVVKFFDTRPKAHFSASNLRDWHFLHVRTISNNMCIPRPGQTMKLHEFLTCVGWLQRIQDFSCWAVLWRVVWFRIISVTSVACFFVFGSLCCPA